MLVGMVAGYSVLTAMFHRVDRRNLLQTILASKYAAVTGRVGPWGELVSHDIDLERPEEFLAEFLKEEAQRPPEPLWSFPGQSTERAIEIMVSSGLDAHAVRQLLTVGNPQVRPTSADVRLEDLVSSMTPETRVRLSRELDRSGPDDGEYSITVVRPDPTLIYSITPETRTRLYRELGRLGANRYMEYPFTYRAGAVDEWLGQSGLSEKTLARVQSLIYRCGTADCFSDLPTLWTEMPDVEERLRLVKALTRQSVVLPRLRVRPDSDVDRLVAYWGHDGRLGELRALFDSLKRLPDGGTVSLAFLLPPFARERVLSYPPPTMNGPVMDCHWSTMNFFNTEPDDRFNEPAYTTEILKMYYRIVPKAGQFGDIVFLFNEQGAAVHSAVYVADDIVFTKNGNNYMQAWLLMRFRDLLAAYPWVNDGSVVAFRRRLS